MQGADFFGKSGIKVRRGASLKIFDRISVIDISGQDPGCIVQISAKKLAENHLASFH